MVHTLINQAGATIQFDATGTWTTIKAYNRAGKFLFSETKPVASARQDWSAYLNDGFART